MLMQSHVRTGCFRANRLDYPGSESIKKIWSIDWKKTSFNVVFFQS